MKKKLIAMAALVLLLAGVVAGTVAYYTDEIETHNVITTGNIEIDLVETTLKNGKEVPFESPVTGLMPGVSASKIVRVHNISPNPAWVRVRVDVKINDKEVDVSAPNSVLNIDFDTTGAWKEHNGCWYYTHKLAGNDSTGDDWYTVPPLFTEVTLLETADNDYQNAEIEISVVAEGIQSDNNELAEGAAITSVWPVGVRIWDYVR